MVERKHTYTSLWEYNQDLYHEIIQKQTRGDWREVTNNYFLLPTYDPSSEFLTVQDFRLHDPLLLYKPISEPIADSLRVEKKQIRYFEHDIPRQIHQIWFGDISKRPENKVKKWEEFSKKYNYTYKLWTNSIEDLKQLESCMLPNNYALLKEQLSLPGYYRYQYAADITRYELLKNYGGIYADCDMTPPEKVDFFSEYTPMKGLMFSPEWCGRNIGTEALFGCMGFLLSSKNHPVLERVVSSLHENVVALQKVPITKDMQPSYHSGAFLFTKCLFGCYTILNRHYLNSFEGTNI